MTKPTLGVVYDVGGTPLDIARGVEEIADLVFIAQDSPHTRSVRELLGQVAPVVDIASVDEAARELQDHGIDGIVTFSEPALPVTSALGWALHLPVHAPETVACVTDKSHQRTRLRERGVEAIWSAPVASRADLGRRADTLPYPIIVKPRVGGASRAVVRLDCVDDLHGYLAAFEGQHDEPLHLEELITGRANHPFGDLVSVETATFRGETRLIAITGNFKQIHPFRETGHLWPAALTADEQLLALDTTLCAIEALGIENGITHTEFKLTDRGPQLIEVNARLGGFINEMCASDPAADLYAAAALIALGLEPWGVLPTEFAPFTFVFMQEPPLEARKLLASSAGPRTQRMSKTYKTLHSPPAVLRTDLGTEWLDAFVSVAPDLATMFDRLSDHVAETSFEFELADGSTARIGGAELPSSEVLAMSAAQR